MQSPLCSCISVQVSIFYRQHQGGSQKGSMIMSYQWKFTKTINSLAHQNRSIVRDVCQKRLMKKISSLIFFLFVWHSNQYISTVINYLLSSFNNQAYVYPKTLTTPPHTSRSCSAYFGFTRTFLIEERHRLFGNLCGKDSEEPEGLKE